jgi:hypothetical protein
VSDQNVADNFPTANVPPKPGRLCHPSTIIGASRATSCVQSDPIPNLPVALLLQSLARFGNAVRPRPDGNWKGVSNELDRLTHHIGEARSKTGTFTRPNSSLRCCQIFSRYPRFGAVPLSHFASFDHRRRPEFLDGPFRLAHNLCGGFV